MGCNSSRQPISNRYNRPAANAIAYPDGNDDKIIVSIREVKSEQGDTPTNMET